jgi:hypothetical protein
VCDPGKGSGVVVACGGNTNTRLLACLPHAATARDTDSVHLLQYCPLPLSSLTRRRRDLPGTHLVSAALLSFEARSTNEEVNLIAPNADLNTLPCVGAVSS